MKNYVFALIVALGLVASPAFAENSAVGELRVQSGFVDRGELVRDDLTGVLDIRINDVVVNGVWVDAELVTLDATSKDLQLRSDLGVGYTFVTDGGLFDVSGSVHRLDNTALYGDAYNEARVELGAVVVDGLRVYARGARTLNTAVDSTYVTVGTVYAWDNRLIADVSASGYQFDGGDRTFNSATASLTYIVRGNLAAFASYTYGGERVDGTQLKDNTVVGLSLMF